MKLIMITPASGAMDERKFASSVLLIIFVSG